MSANELLEKVSQELARLPQEEREKFFDGIVGLEQAVVLAAPARPSRPVRRPDIRSRHRRIFGEQVLAQNVVLAAREEEDS